MKIRLKLIPTVLQYDNKLKRNFIVSLFLSSMLSFVSVGVSVFSYSLFLSSYSISWIPYWILSESLLIFLTGNFLSFFMPHEFRKFAQYILGGASAVVFLSLGMQVFSWYWAPFVIVLFLRTFITIVSTAIWSLLPTLFYYQQFKKIINRFTISASLAAIFSPFLYSIIATYFNLFLILVFVGISLVTGIFVLKFSTHILSNAGIERHKQQQPFISPFRYPLFRTVLIISLLLSILYECGEFLFRVQLNQYFNQEQIALFISIFISLASFISLLTQLLAPTIFARLQIYQIFQIIFLCIGLAGVAYWISPTLGPAALLAGIKIVFEHGWVSINRKNITNIFPPIVMGRCELYIRSYISPAGGVAAALLGIFSTRINMVLNYFPVIFILLSIIGMATAFLLFKQYIITLKEMVIPRGFLTFYRTKGEQQQLQKLVLERLEKSNVNEVEVSLITPSLFKKPPSILYEILASNSNEHVKTVIIKVLNEYPLYLLEVQKLLKIAHEEELLSDENQELMLKLLSDIHSPELLLKAKKRLKEYPHSKSALLVLLKNGDIQAYTSALQATVKLARSEKSFKRMTAASLLSTLGAGRFYDLKKKLITDKELQVRIVAFHHLPAEDIQYLLPSLGKIFNYNTIRILHQRLKLEELIPLAMRLMQLYRNSEEYALSAISFITPIPSETIESCILEFLNIKNNQQRTLLSRQLLERKKQITFSHLLSQKLIEALKYEVELVQQYRKILKDSSLDFAKILITNRIYYATLRFLSWYAAYHQDTASIYVSISKLNPYTLTGEAKEIQGKAIELLIANEKDFNIRTMIETVFDGELWSKAAPLNLEWQTVLFNDPWLRDLLAKYFRKGEGGMNPLQRIIALQKTAFFESLPDEVLYELGQCCELLDCAQNEVIISEGEEGDKLYILVEGEIAIYKNKQLLTCIQPVTCIGEMALLGSQARTTTAISVKRSLLLALLKDDFIKITNEFPQILHNIIKIISQRFLEQISLYEGTKGAVDSLSELH